MLPDPQPLTNRMHSLLTSAQADEDLRRYFGIGQPSGAALFTGRRFEHLAGGGDRPAVDNIVTADDLIAVQTLSVMIPAQGALDLLEGRLGVKLSELLHEIPNHMDMADACRRPRSAPRAAGPPPVSQGPRDGQRATDLRCRALDASPRGAPSSELHRTGTPVRWLRLRATGRTPWTGPAALSRARCRVCPGRSRVRGASGGRRGRRR